MAGPSNSPNSDSPQERRFSGYSLPAFISLVGLFIILAAADVIPSDPASYHAPRWVVGMFALLLFYAFIRVALQVIRGDVQKP